jgi:hypothetical protein
LGSPTTQDNALNRAKVNTGRTRIYLDGFKLSGDGGVVVNVGFDVNSYATAEDSQILSLDGRYWSRSEQREVLFQPVAAEFVIGDKVDSDGDDLADLIDNCVHTSNPSQYDEDGNGIGEACEGQPVIVSDDDQDGMDDTWELDHGLDPNNPDDADLDGDGDGVANIDEWLGSTDPRLADTDGDKIPDGWDSDNWNAQYNECGGYDLESVNIIVYDGEAFSCHVQNQLTVIDATTKQGSTAGFGGKEIRIKPNTTFESGSRVFIQAD